MHKRWGSVQIEDRHGQAWKSGRAHLSVATGKHESNDGKERFGALIGFEWAHLHRTLRDLALKVSTTGEETLDIHYGLGLLGQHWWTLDLERGGKMIRFPGIRFEIRLRLTGIDWCFGPDDDSWSRNASWKERLRRNNLKWWRVHRHRRSEELVDMATDVVRLPEAEVPVTISLFREVWGWEVGPYKLTRTSKRRLRFKLPGGERTEYAIEVEAEPGKLTFPGKGENSWDMGQNFFTSLHTHYDGVIGQDQEWIAYGVGLATQDVLRQRLRYGQSTADTGA